MLTRKDIAEAFVRVGLEKGDTCVFHSSFKSLGPVEGGAAAVIGAFLDVIGETGTLVAPTLSQKDFFNTYNTWSLDKPSEVGYLTEYLRTMPGSLRSDQATHSVAARGKDAWELTHEHTAYGPRPCPFGEYAFADSSPWYKLYLRNARVVFIGVTMKYNTLKHLVEGMLVQKLGTPDGVQSFENRWSGVWPAYKGEKMQEYLDSLGLVRKTTCGPARILCVDAKTTCDASLKAIYERPEDWYSGETLEWIRRNK